MVDLHEGSHLQWTKSHGRFQEPEKKYSIMEAVNWVCTRVQVHQEWISQVSLLPKGNTMLEAMNFDINVPWIVQ